MQVKNDTRSITGYNQVGDIDINYSILQETNEPAVNISASLEKAGKRIGNVNAFRDGRLYLSIDQGNNLSTETVKNILSTILDDINEKFNETV